MIGAAESKRTEYFLKAAETVGLPVTVVSYHLAAKDDTEPLGECMVKLDPPTYHSADISDIYSQLVPYLAFWERLSTFPGIRFLNEVEAIIQTLDKRVCKQALLAAEIACTPLLPEAPDFITLREIMLLGKISGAFIKPRWGSGAAGVLALRVRHKREEDVLCTSAKLLPGGNLMNTKQLRRLSDPIQIETIVNSVLTQGAIIEEWLPKARINGWCFDLRVVYQFGKIAYITTRQSTWPITNLHLNNRPFTADFLSDNVLAEIESLCHKAAGVFPGLRVSGMDVLLEPGTFNPLIIEINAQGDLIYQDIFADNRIYTEQTLWIAKNGA